MSNLRSRPGALGSLLTIEPRQWQQRIALTRQCLEDGSALAGGVYKTYLTDPDGVITCSPSPRTDLSFCSIFSAIDAIPKNPPVRNTTCDQTCEPRHPWQDERQGRALPYLWRRVLSPGRLIEAGDDPHNTVSSVLEDGVNSIAGRRE